MTILDENEIARLRRENEELRNEIISLKQALNQDDFTLTHNRRYFIESLENICCNSDNPFSVLFIDVDSLKSVNDKFGHAAGDEILLQVAHMLCAAIGERDILARMGGDEFAILMHDVDHGDNVRLIERLLDNIHAIDFQIDNMKMSVTVSIGIANGYKGVSPDALLAEADHNMYHHKKYKNTNEDQRIISAML